MMKLKIKKHNQSFEHPTQAHHLEHEKVLKKIDKSKYKDTEG